MPSFEGTLGELPSLRRDRSCQRCRLGYGGQMKRITIRDNSVNLPAFPQEMELTQLSSLDRVAGQLNRFSLAHLRVRALDLESVELHEGKVRSVHAESVGIRRVSTRSLQFDRCNLGMLRWSGGKISETWFDTCKLLGARFENITLDNVVFTNCKLDYSTLSHVRASGPVIFSQCSLRETDFDGCDFSRALFDDCDLVLANFGHGIYAGCDLRGNDLSAVTGISNLKSVIIGYGQLMQLAQAVASELNVNFGDDPNV